ncbi:MAG: hypothetical protein L0323_23030 [Planctomycetes bacterium]|nr:hypothetical protein [Planctomycetota bacterium]
MILAALVTSLLTPDAGEVHRGVVEKAAVTAILPGSFSGGAAIAAGPGTSFPGLAGPPGSVFPAAGMFPPDPTLAVGPDHVVETVNSTLGIFDKVTGALVSSVPLGFGGFFGPVGAASMVFDPRCLYDQYEGRFVVIGLSVTLSPAGTPTASTIYIGISDDDSAPGLWYVYATPSLIPVTTPAGFTPGFADFPGLGVDASAVYVTAWLDVPGIPPRANLYRIFPKTAGTPGTGLYFGMSASFTDLIEPFPLPPAPGAPFPPVFTAVKPAHHFGANPLPYFLSAMSTLTGVAGTFSTIRVQVILDPLGPSPTLCTNDIVAVPPYTTPTFGIGATQPGTGEDLRVILGELLNAVWRGGSLFTAHGIASGGKTVARWYHLADPVFSCLPICGVSCFIVAGAGEIDGGPGVHTFFPAIMANASLDVTVVFAMSSPATFPGVYFAGRAAADPPGVMTFPITPLATGTASYFPAPAAPWQVWGDYFGSAVDPDDDATFWGVGEVALDSTTWGTSIGILDIGLACGTFTPYGIGLAGSGGVIPALEGTGIPLAGSAVSVDLTGGLGGATGVLAVSLASASIPLVGGTILVDLASAFFFPLALAGPGGVPGAGTASLGFVVPPLAGLEAFFQAGVLDAGAAAGIALSNGLEMCIG